MNENQIAITLGYASYEELEEIMGKEAAQALVSEVTCKKDKPAPEENYHHNGKLTASKIKLILENAKKYYQEYVSPDRVQKKTTALTFGDMLHTTLFEPEKYKKKFIKLGKVHTVEGAQEAAEMLGIPFEEGELVRDIRVKINAYIEENGLLIEPENEKEKGENIEEAVALIGKQKIPLKEFKETNLTIFDLVSKKNERIKLETAFEGELQGRKAQCKPDMLINLGENEPFWIVLDLKTTKDGTRRAFSRDAENRLYFLQEFIYKEILKQNNIHVSLYIYVVYDKVNKSVVFYKNTQESVEDGADYVSAAVEKLEACEKSGDWGIGEFDFEKGEFKKLNLLEKTTLRGYKKQELTGRMF